MKTTFAHLLTYSAFASQLFAYQYVMYWGQNTAGNEKSLKELCADNKVDIINLSFMHIFDGVSEPKFDLSSHCGGSPCKDVEEGILACQAKGKKVALSLGGAVGQYGLASPQAAESFAAQIFNGYLSGKGGNINRPFGDAKLDGVDLDLENNKPENFDRFVTKLRELQPNVLVTAAPQCPFPDASMGLALDNSKIDAVYVQFYNNPQCNVDGGFNFQTWHNWAEQRGAKVYLGVPATPAAAGTGYVDEATLKTKIDQVKGYSTFAGVMMWDASHAFGPNGYGNSIADYIHSIGGGSPQPQPPASSQYPASSQALNPSPVPSPASISSEVPAPSQYPVSNQTPTPPSQVEASSTVVPAPPSQVEASSTVVPASSSQVEASSTVVPAPSSQVEISSAVVSASSSPVGYPTGAPTPIASSSVESTPAPTPDTGYPTNPPSSPVLFDERGFPIDKALYERYGLLPDSQ